MADGNGDDGTAQAILWWYNELARAERSVTIASQALDAATAPWQASTMERILDSRLDWLADVEDVTDAITAEIERECPRVAPMIVDRYVRHMPWDAVAKRSHLSEVHARHLCKQAIARVQVDRISGVDIAVTHEKG